MDAFFTKYKDVIAGIASLSAILSLYFLLLASLASRKENILKTAPLLTLEMKDGKLSVKNLNGKFAYRFKSENFYHINKESDIFGIFPVGMTVYRLEFSGTNYISSGQNNKTLKLISDNKSVTSELRHYLFARLLGSKRGLCLFYYDSQNHRFISRVNSDHDDSTINNNIILNVVSTPKYAPYYAIHIWIYFFFRSLHTYMKNYRALYKIWLEKRRNET